MCVAHQFRHKELEHSERVKMGRYTLNSDKAADMMVERELGVVVDRVAHCFGKREHAVLLGGGFGRGEGSILHSDGTYRPLNDYDILIVVRQGRYLPAELLVALDRMAGALADELSVKQVDVVVKDGWRLAIPSPTVGRYELSHGHQLLAGRLSSPIRCFSEKHLPVSEGATYYRNRAGGMLIAKLLLAGYGPFIDAERAELAGIEIDKAIMAIGDAELLADRSYHFSYQERRRRVKKGGARLVLDAELRQWYADAIRRKLAPEVSHPDLNILHTKWCTVGRVFVDKFLDFERRRLRRSIENMSDYCRSVLRRGFGARQLLLRPELSAEDFWPRRLERSALVSLLAAELESSIPNGQVMREYLGAKESVASLKRDHLIARLLRKWHPLGIVGQLAPR